jgi:DASH complex subunit ASK1
MSTKRENIVPNPPRWKPNPNPATIPVPGLDTAAPVHDQIDQIEQLITIKLQVLLHAFFHLRICLT